MLKFFQWVGSLFTRKSPPPVQKPVQKSVPLPAPRPLPPPVTQPKVSAPQKAAWIAIAITIVAAWEGLSLKPYHDSVGVLTVCYGATAADQVDLKRTYTKEECQDMLADDLPKYDEQVRQCIHVEMNPNVEAAVVSLAYNVGPAAVCHGSVARNLNAGNVRAACDSFLGYDRAGGHVLVGLENRRKAEQALCLKGAT